jgi:hypothetical protein
MGLFSHASRQICMELADLVKWACVLSSYAKMTIIFPLREVACTGFGNFITITVMDIVQSSVFHLKQTIFGDCILSLSSGDTYSVGLNRQRYYLSTGRSENRIKLFKTGINFGKQMNIL